MCKWLETCQYLYGQITIFKEFLNTIFLKTKNSNVKFCGASVLNLTKLNHETNKNVHDYAIYWFTEVVWYQ